jgi:hypothetical protein
MKTWQKIGLVVGAISVWLGINAWAGHYAYQQGVEQGMHDMLGICYHIGGMIIDKTTGLVIECTGVSQLPPNELEQLQNKT